MNPKILNKSSRFVVGWTGTPNRPFKGFHDYIVPAVERAAQMRPGLELKTRFSGPLETLPRFYDDVDVILIASSADAGPSLFMEGGFCEVPSISTRIGIPSEVIEHGQNGLFVERNVEKKWQWLWFGSMMIENFSFPCRVRFVSMSVGSLGKSLTESVGSTCSPG